MFSRSPDSSNFDKDARKEKSKKKDKDASTTPEGKHSSPGKEKKTRSILKSSKFFKLQKGIPSREKINGMWQKLADEIGLPKGKRSEIDNLNPEYKWLLVKANEEFHSTQDNKRGALIKSAFEAHLNGTFDMNAHENMEFIKFLRLAIIAQTEIWSAYLLELGYIEKLSLIILELDCRKALSPDELELQYGIAYIIKSVLVPDDNFSSQPVLERFINSPISSKIIKSLILCIDSKFSKTKKIVFDFFSFVINLTDYNKVDSHGMVLEAFDFFKYNRNKRHRFEYLVESLKFETDTMVQVSALILINALVNTSENLDKRISIRCEFLGLGLEDLFDALKKEHGRDDVTRQIEVFENDVHLDNEEFSERLKMNNVEIDVNDKGQLIGALTGYTREKPYLNTVFSETIKYLLLMPKDHERGLKMWYLVEKIIRQISSLKDEILINENQVLDIEELLLVAEDRVALESLKKSSFEKEEKLALEIELLNSELEKKGAEIKEIQDRMKMGIEAEVSKVKSEIYAEMEETFNKKLAAEQAGLFQELERYKMSERSFMLDLERLEIDRNYLNEELNEKKSVIESLRVNYEADLKKSCQKLIEEIEGYLKEIKSYKTALERREMEIEVLKRDKEICVQEALTRQAKELLSKYEMDCEKISKEYQDQLSSVRIAIETRLKSEYEDQIEKLKMDYKMRVQADLLKGLEESGMDELRDDLTPENLSNFLHRKDSKLESLERQLEDKNVEISRVTNSLNDFRCKLDEKSGMWDKERQNYIEKIQKLEERVEDLERSLNSSLEKKQLLAEQISMLNSRHSFAEVELARKYELELERQKQTLADYIKSVEVDRQLQMKQNEAAVSEVIKQQELLRQESENRVRSLMEQQVLVLKNELEGARKELKLCEERLDEVVGENKKMIAVEKMKNERNLDVIKKSQEEEKRVLEDKIRALEKAKDRIAVQMIDLHEKYSRIKSENESLKAAEGDLTESNQYLASNDSSTLLAQINRLKRKNLLLKNTIAGLKEEVKERKAEEGMTFGSLGHVSGFQSAKFIDEENQRLAMTNRKAKVSPLGDGVESKAFSVVDPSTNEEIMQLSKKLDELSEGGVDLLDLVDSGDATGSKGQKSGVDLKLKRVDFLTTHPEGDYSTGSMVEKLPPGDEVQARKMANTFTSKEIRPLDDGDGSHPKEKSTNSGVSGGSSDPQVESMKQCLMSIYQVLKKAAVTKELGVFDELVKTFEQLNMDKDFPLEALHGNVENLDVRDSVSGHVDDIDPSQVKLPVEPPLNMPPPPPPPLAASKKVDLSGPKPKSPMRNLQWIKIPNTKISKTIFDSLNPSKVDLDTQQLESLFFLQKSSNKGFMSKKSTQEKDASFSVLDARRLQNIGIFLQTFKIPISELQDAILMLDEGILTMDLTQKLLNNFPTSTEVAAIQEYLDTGGELKKMTAIDNFLLNLSKIPQASVRLECLLCKHSFSLKDAEVKQALLRVKKATFEFLKSQDNFAKLLEIILAIGNFLNFGTSRGLAAGFQLESLLKLSETKSTVGSETLLHYVNAFIEEKYPELTDWYSELGNLSYASKIVWAQVCEDISSLRKSLMDCEELSKTVVKCGQWDVFHNVFPQFLVDAFKELETLEALQDRISTEYKQIISTYPCSSQIQPEEFFKLIGDFVSQFEKVRREFKLKKSREKKDIRKKAEDKITLKGEKGKLKTEQVSISNEKAPSVEENAALNIIGTDVDISGISGMGSVRIFEKRRLRRQNTLRQKRLINALE